MVKDILQIFWKFFKMGAVTFGGGYAMLPILRREVIEKAGWMQEEEILDYYALSQGLPGIIAINVSTFIGYHHMKTPGAISAALGVVSPSIIIITAIAMFLSGFKDNVYVQHALAGISVCVIALILDAVIGMWKKGVKDIWGYIIFAVALLVSMFTKLSPVLLVIGAAVAGIIIRSVKRASETGKGAEKK